MVSDEFMINYDGYWYAGGGATGGGGGGGRGANATPHDFLFLLVSSVTYGDDDNTPTPLC